MLTAVVALGGCDLSNDLFEEDALFVRAVPTVEDVRTEHPASRDVDGRLVDDAPDERGGGEIPATIPPQARGVAQTINGIVFGFLGSLDWVMNQPITTRERNSRTWGPFEAEDRGSWTRLVVERTPDAPRLFVYALEVSDDREAWAELLGGEFTRGEAGLRDGQGSFCFDADLSAQYDGGEYGGLMCVDHARAGDEVTLHVVFDDWLDEDGDRTRISYFFRHAPGEGGVLEYATDADFLGDGDGLVETSATRLRWRPGGPGRADLRLSGGSLGATEVAGTECWDERFVQDYWLIDHEGGEFEEERGDAALCTYAEREDVREL